MSQDESESRQEIVSIKHTGIQNINMNTIQGQARGEWREFSPNKFVIAILVIQVLLFGTAITSFMIDEMTLTADSTEMKEAKNNMEKIKGCEKFVFDKAFHKRMFINSGLTSFNIFSMVFFIYRMNIGLSKMGYEYHLQDQSNLRKTKKKICC